MKILLDNKISLPYKSNSQKIRVTTEQWVADEVFCPNCSNHINQFEGNRPVADFFCENCRRI